MSTLIGIDWGLGQDKAACVIFKLDGKNAIVQDTFELTDTEVDVLERSGAPKDIVISDGIVGDLPTTREEVDEEWLRKVVAATQDP